MALDDTGIPPPAAPAAPPPASAPEAATTPTTPPSTPGVRGLIDQSRKMGATDEQIRDLMVKAPFLKDTWQASESAGISPDAVFQHFGLSAPNPNAAPPDRTLPTVDDFGRIVGGDVGQDAPPSTAALADQGTATKAPAQPLPDVDDFGRDISQPAAGQGIVNDVASRIGQAVMSGWRDTPDILTPEAQSWLANAERNNPRPNAQDVLTVGHAFLAAGNAAFRGGLEGIAALGDVVGQPQLGRDAAGYFEAMGMHGAPHMPGMLRATLPETRAILTERSLAAARPSASDAVAAIGKATDVDGAIAAAGEAAAAPAVVEPVQAPAPTEGAPAQSTAPAETAPAVPAANDRAMPPEAEAATPAPELQSVGAAAASDLDPDIGNLTPKQELAYRSNAEGQKLLEPQEYGVPDKTAYVKGVTPNEAETAQTVDAARELKSLKITNPDVAGEAAAVLDVNSAAQKRHQEQLSGSKIDVDNAEAVRDEQMEAELNTAWDNKTDADTQPVVDAANAILQSRDGRRPLVRNVIQSVLKELTDSDGNEITDPQILYGVGDHINDLLNENDAGGQKKNARASSALLALKDALYNQVIEPAAPGFRQALDNYHQASIRIDEMKALQQFEPKLYDANNRMTNQKYQTMMRQIVDSRMAPGINPFKSISDDTMAGLWSLRDDLRRTAAAERNARTPGGSDTAQNTADVAALVKAGVGRAVGKAALRAVPYLGKAAEAYSDIRDPIIEAREAQARSARGMAMLHPETPPIERQDHPTPAQTQIERERASVAAMKARSGQGRAEFQLH